MPSAMADDTKLLFVPVGSNPARPFGMEAKDRACRLAANAGFDCADAPGKGRAALISSLGYAWDPAWLKVMAARPASVLMLDSRPVLANVPVGHSIAPVEQAMLGSGGSLDGLEQLDAHDTKVSYDELRKREQPFVLPLSPSTADEVEQAAYDASYKGVTDALTLYLWRKPAFHLTRWAAELGFTHPVTRSRLSFSSPMPPDMQELFNALGV